MENKGQIADAKGNLRPDILFSAKSGGTQLWLAKNAIHYQFSHAEKSTDGKPKMPGKDFTIAKTETKFETHHFAVQLEGANENAVIIKEKPTEYVENYYLAHCPNGVLDVKSYEKITYKNIYPNIDWVIYTKGGFMEYDFIIHPGGKPSDIKIKVKDADSVNIENGELVVKTRLGEVHEKKPVSYDENGTKIATRFVKGADGSLSFEANFPKYKSYTIDPEVVWATYYGGSSGAYGTSSTIDVDNNVYLLGDTSSTSGIASGGFSSTFSGVSDFYLVKFSSTGARLWATYYGGDGDEYPGQCKTDSFGNVYLAGGTASTSGMASGGFQNTYGGDMFDALLVKFDSSGARIWATYYGGEFIDIGLACVIDSSDNVFVAGQTLSPSNIASGGYQNTKNGEIDAFLVKFNSSGSRLWGTYYGGSLNDWITDLALDTAGNIFTAGGTTSNDDIASPGSYLVDAPGTSETNNVFITKFDTSGTRIWATYYGGMNNDSTAGCATDNDGNLYVGGLTESTSGIASGGFQNTYGGGYYDAYLAKFTAEGQLAWGTYYGGPEIDDAWDTKVDNSGNIYLCGTTRSTTDIASGGFQNTYGGGDTDGYVVKFNSSGSRLWGSYFGGPAIEWVYSIATGSNDVVYFAGSTESTSGIAQNGFQNTHSGGGYDAFLLKISAENLEVAIPVPDINFSYFPNPVKDDLTIKSSTIINSVSVYNLLGQKVITEQLDTTEGAINMQVLKEGSYIVYVTTSGTSKSFIVLKGK